MILTVDSDESLKGDKKRFSKKYIVSSVILLLSVLLCVLVVTMVLTRGYVNCFGYSMFRVVTGSMEPTMPVGTAVINKSVDINDIEPGDIICFRSRESSHFGVIVTHRVVSKQTDSTGEVLLETRGDANIVSDVYFVSKTNLIGRVIWFSGKESVLTNMFSFISGKLGFFACIVFPVLLIAGLVLQNTVKNLKKEINRAMEEISKNENSDASFKAQLLPGYETLTKEDYEEIYQILKQEISEELKNRVEESDSKTE